MEWINSSSSTVQEKQQQQEENGMTVEGLYAKVMTDEQMELLRKQIAVYAMICEQLVDMHKSFSAQYDTAGEEEEEIKRFFFFFWMEWNSSSISVQENVLMVEELYVKVMTDEQMELLRKQIAVYAMISEQLVEMHNSLSAQYDIAGMRLGNPYLDPFMSSGGQKLTTRQRWTPTPVQLQILERVYDECSGNPGKQKILDMTAELAHHGQISETNVYNWFQNRRARIKRKQSGVPSNTTETEAKKHVMSKKYTTPESIQSFENPTARITENNIYFQSPNIGMEQMIGKMDVAGMVFSPPLPHWQMDRYDMLG